MRQSLGFVAIGLASGFEFTWWQLVLDSQVKLRRYPLLEVDKPQGRAKSEKHRACVARRYALEIPTGDMSMSVWLVNAVVGLSAS